MSAATEPFVLGLLHEANAQALTPHQIARTARLTESTVLLVMDGRHDPCPRMQQLLAQAVHSSPAELYALGEA